MSVDLVGSTAVKQQQRFPLDDPKKIGQESDYSQPWLSPIADFFSKFGQVFEESWALTKHNAPKGMPTGAFDPELWKANGDELIYVKELSDRRDLFLCIHAFVQALQKYREELRKGGRLDIKGTCWTAGFPISNVEVIFERDVRRQVGEYADDPRLRQFYLRELWHHPLPSARENLIRDFIGPSVDTGFRLTTLATPRKLPISVEVAWLLSTAHLPQGAAKKGIHWFPMRYDGRKELKGVLGGKPYPVFWIDVLEADKTARAEDKLLPLSPLVSDHDVSAFCDAFLDEQKGHLFNPFIVDETDEQYGELPAHFGDTLLMIADRYAAEKKRYQEEHEEPTPDPARDHMKMVVSEEVIKSLAAALEKAKARSSSTPARRTKRLPRKPKGPA
jgi:hypothetical protein